MLARIVFAMALLVTPAAHADSVIAGPPNDLIRYDASSEGTGTTTLSWTHTPVGTPYGVVVFCVNNTVTTDVFSGATYGGVAMTQIASATDSVTELAFVEGYFLGASIPTGAQTVQCTVASGSTAKWGVAFSLTNPLAADMESLGSCTVTANATNCGCNITPTKSEVSFHVFGQFHGAAAPGTVARPSYTMRHTHDFGSQVAHSGTMSRTVARDTGPSTGVVLASDDCAHVGIAVGIQ